jgi:hypothetical protein
MKCLANGVQVGTDANVIYNFPAGFHVASTVATATAVTLTPYQLLTGLILQDPSGGAVATTLPTAADLVAAYNGVAANSSLRFVIRNTADAAEAITTTVSTGITANATDILAIAQNETAEYLLLFTNVTPGNEAATLYTLNISTTQT